MQYEGIWFSKKQTYENSNYGICSILSLFSCYFCLLSAEMQLVIQVPVLTHSDLVFSLWCFAWFLDWPIKMHVSVPNVVDNVINGQLGHPCA